MLLLLLFIVVPAIGSSTEAREAHVAWEMYENHELVLPLRNGLVPSKPPLFHWTAAAVAELFGNSNAFTTRLVSLLAGSLLLVVTVLSASLLLSSTVPAPKANPLRAGLLAGAALSLSPGFVRLSGDARVDMLFSLFASSAIMIFLHACASYISGRSSFDHAFNSGKITAFFLLCALATLAKGPLGLVLPIICAFSMLGYSAGWRRSLRFFVRPRIGWLIFVLVAVPWYVLAALKGEGAFVNRQLVFENLLRFFGGENVNTEPPWFYLTTVFSDLFPWSLMALALFIRSAKLSRARNESVSGLQNRLPYRARNLPLVCALTGLIFFSLSSGKRHTYLLPLFPFLAIYFAWAADEYWITSSKQFKLGLGRNVRRLAVGCAVLLTVMLFAIQYTRLPLPVAAPSVQQAIQFVAAWRPVLELWLALILLVLALMALRGAAAAVQLWFLYLALVVFFFSVGLGIKNDLKGFDRAAEQIRSRMGGAPLSAVRLAREEYLDPLLFYLKHPVNLIEPRAGLERCSGYYVLQPHHMGVLSAAGKVNIAARFRQIHDEEKGRTDRDILLVQCYSSGSPGEGSPLRERM
ncbi:MAG: hypothetical protein J5J00_13805 [Deltaproteobacteria bacterium]|nr:hypothetical protein [Deltaproteobacteria bacterium]